LHEADPTSAHLTLNDLKYEPTIYLLPEYDIAEEPGQHLQSRCKEIFEEQLEWWFRVPTAWPLTGPSKFSSAGLSTTPTQS
jgi:hypothetical protein